MHKWAHLHKRFSNSQGCNNHPHNKKRRYFTPDHSRLWRMHKARCPRIPMLRSKWEIAECPQTGTLCLMYQENAQPVTSMHRHRVQLGQQHNSTGPGRISFRSHRTSSISQASHVCSKAKATSPGSIAKPHLCHSWHSNARAKDVSLQKEYLRALRSRNSSYFTTQITRITAPRKTAAAKTPIHQIDLYRSI